MSASTGGGTGQGGPSMSGGNELQAAAMVVNSRLIMPPGSMAGFGVEDPAYGIELDGMMKFHNQGTLPNSKSLALYCTDGNDLYWQNQLLSSGAGTHATDITVTDRDATDTYYPTFVEGASTKQDIYIQDAKLKYIISNPSGVNTGTLVTDKLQITKTGATAGALEVDSIQSYTYGGNALFWVGHGPSLQHTIEFATSKSGVTDPDGYIVMGSRSYFNGEINGSAPYFKLADNVSSSETTEAAMELALTARNLLLFLIFQRGHQIVIL